MFARATDNGSRYLAGVIGICLTSLWMAAFGCVTAAGAQETPTVAAPADASADATTIDALLRLGDLYSGGGAVDVDLPKAFAYYKRAAAAGSAAGKLRMAEMLAHGEGTEKDVDAALALIRDVAKDASDPHALMLLGDLYARGDVIQADGAKAAAAYERAYGLGALDALLSLGDLYSSGTAIAVDPPRAFRYYKQAADAGSATARLEVGYMLVSGFGTPRDAKAGFNILNGFAAGGSATALVQLGDIYLRGEDGKFAVDSAIVNYEKAAGMGDTTALYKLGSLFAYGTLVPADGKRALAYYQKAADAGDVRASYAIGRGLVENLFGTGSVDQGVQLLVQTAARGVADAEVDLALRYMYGYGVKRAPKQALDLLNRAWEGGNVAAGLELVDIYRDGVVDGRLRLIGQQAKLALSIFNKLKSRLDVADRIYDEILFGVRGRSLSAYRAAYERMLELPRGKRSELVRALVRSNENAYIFFVQKRLTEEGIFGGTMNGMLDGPTIHAIVQFCDQVGMSDVCRIGPMSGPVAEILSYQF